MGMEDMNMNINTSMNDGATAFYEVNMGEYGMGVGSMMALMTEQEHPASGENSMMSTITVTMPPPSSSFLTYGHGHVEGLFSAAAVFHGGGNPTTGHRHHHEKHLVGGHFQPEQLAMHEQAAAVISESSLSSVKTEGYSNHLEFHRKAGTGGRGGSSCFPEPSIILRSQSQSQSQSRQSRSQQEHQQLEGSRMVNSLDVESECSNNPNDSIDALKTKIAGHPHYPRLLAAYMDCQKIGAPAEVGAVLDKISQENQHGRHSPTINVGADPELDQFMEAYCEMLGKFHLEISKPFKEAMAYVNKIETQLSCLSIGAIRNCPPGEGYLEDREDGGGSSEEDFSCGEIDMHGVDPRAEDKELKDQLLRKYSGYFSSLKQEFLKKKKKGKLPKEARQKLLDWWSLHYKWPYPSETDKVALAESTGLDQKQINNWFINQRKRHWKPSEEMQFVVMDNPHSASFYIDGAEG